MRRSAIGGLLAITLAILAPAALAQNLPVFHVIASRGTVIRVTPDIDGDRVARLERGDFALCITDPATRMPQQDDDNNFYRVRLRTGQLGWALRSMTRVHTGPPPEPVPTQDETALDIRKAFHLAVGEPRGYTVLANDGYVVGYDPRLKIPAWVQYRLTIADFAEDRPRSNAFTPDQRIPVEGRALLTDYDVASGWDLWIALGLDPTPSSLTTPNYARGHMTPARSQTRSEALEERTYLLSNMAPQVHSGFNSGTWSALESRVRAWCEVRGELTIVMGPVFYSSTRQIDPEQTEAARLDAVEEGNVFDEDIPAVLAQPPTERQVIYNVVGPNDVAIPTGFFKIVVDNTNPQDPEVLAFLFPHYRKTVAMGRDLEDLLVSVNEIERLTGLDLLHELGNEAIEEEAAGELWN